MPAEFEELRITVKVADEASGQLGALKQGLDKLGGLDVTRKFEGIHKQVSGIEQEIKKLMLNFATGGPSLTALANFAKGIGPIGLAAVAVYETLKVTIGFLKGQAQDLLNMEAMARRAGESTAQHIRTMEEWERAGVPIEKAGQQWERFVDTWNHLRRMDEQGRATWQELLTGLRGDDARRAEQRIREIIAMPNAQEAANALKKFFDDVGRHYARQADIDERRKGPEEQRRLLRIWGLPDLDRVRQAFTIVDEQEAADMDRMVQAAREFNEVSVEIEQNWNRILQAMGTRIMEGPLGPLLRLIEKATAAEAKRLEESKAPGWWELLGMLPGNMLLKGLGQAIGVDIWGGLGGIFTGQTKAPGAELKPGAPGNMAVPLMSTGMQDVTRELEKQRDYTGELTDQFRRLNALLSGEDLETRDLAKQLGLPDVKGNPAFHNQPQGGAVGESNPMQLPASEPQPGGGAPAEARATPTEAKEPLLRPYREGDVSRGTYTSKGVTKQYPILSAAATPLQPQFPGEQVYTGVSKGKGVASWYGFDPAFYAKDDPSDPKGSNALRVPERYQGISLSTGKSGELGSSGQSLGQQHLVFDPNTQLTYVKQQTDYGPGIRTQKMVDASAAMAARIEQKSGKIGYTRKEWEAMQEKVEKGEVAPWEVQPAGFGTYGRPGFEGKDITAPMVKGVDPTTETQNIYELDTRKLLNPSLDYRPDYAGGSGRAAVPKGLEGAPRTVGEQAFGGAGAFDVGGSEWKSRLTSPEEGLETGKRIPKSEILLAAKKSEYDPTQPLALMGTDQQQRKQLGESGNVPLPRARPQTPQQGSELDALTTLGAKKAEGKVYAYDAPNLPDSPTVRKAIAEDPLGFSYPKLGEVYYRPGSGEEITTIAHEYGHVGREAVRQEALKPGGNIFERYKAYVDPKFEGIEPKQQEERLQRHLDFDEAQRLRQAGAITPQEYDKTLKETAASFRTSGTGAGTEREELEASRHIAAQENLARKILDKGLARENEPEPKGNLDVRVNAPNGTKVKADGDGMFKGNVSLDRRMELPTLQ